MIRTILRKLRYWAQLRHHARALRMWLGYNLMPKDVSEAIDAALALGYAIERTEGWAQAADPQREAVPMYLPANMARMYDLFMCSTCLFPDCSVYERAAAWVEPEDYHL